MGERMMSTTSCVLATSTRGTTASLARCKRTAATPRRDGAFACAGRASSALKTFARSASTFRGKEASRRGRATATRRVAAMTTGEVKLSDYKGKKLVLSFFPCCFSGAVDDGCQCQLEAVKALSDAGVSVVGISRDQPFAQKAWMEKLGNPDLLCLSDFTLATAEAYVGTFNFGEFLDGVGVSKGLTGYVTSNRGTIAIDEEGT